MAKRGQTKRRNGGNCKTVGGSWFWPFSSKNKENNYSPPANNENPVTKSLGGRRRTKRNKRRSSKK